MKVLGKYLPIVFGLAIGWLMFHPPEALQSLGIFGYLIMAALTAALSVAFVAVLISSNLPADPKLTLVPETEVPTDLRRRAEDYLRLGFAPAAPPLQVSITPPAILLGFVNENERTCGTVYRTSTIPAKTSFDFVSVFENGRGSLTTGASAEAGNLPAGPGEFKQGCPGASVEELHRTHLEGLAHLERHGLVARSVSPSTFEEDLKEGVARQRRSFMASPIANTILTIWRVVTKQNPHRGPLEHQEVARRQILRLG